MCLYFISAKMSQSKSQLDESTKPSTVVSLPLSIEAPSILSITTRSSFQTAFFNFLRDFKQKYKRKKYKCLLRRAARRWHAMSQADRAPYILEAARNRKRAKPKRTTSTQNKKKQKQNENKEENKRCPVCGHQKTSRESSTSRKSSHSKSSKSSKSIHSNNNT